MASSLKLKNIMLVGLFLFFLIVILCSFRLVNFREGATDKTSSSDSSDSSDSKSSDAGALGSTNNNTKTVSNSKMNAFNKSLIDLQNQFNALSND